MIHKWRQIWQKSVYFFMSMNNKSIQTRITFWLSSAPWFFHLWVKGQTGAADTFYVQLVSMTFLFLSPWNLISLTWKRPLGLVLINLLVKRLKQKKVICCQLKLLVMESSQYSAAAGVIAHFSAICFNSLYIHAIVRPVCNSRVSSFSVICLMGAVQ